MEQKEKRLGRMMFHCVSMSHRIYDRDELGKHPKNIAARQKNIAVWGKAEKAFMVVPER
jgi:hypothetical protein